MPPLPTDRESFGRGHQGEKGFESAQRVNAGAGSFGDTREAYGQLAGSAAGGARMRDYENINKANDESGAQFGRALLLEGFRRKQANEDPVLKRLIASGANLEQLGGIDPSSYDALARRAGEVGMGDFTDARADRMHSLDLLKRVASGQDSIARQQARRSGQQLASGIASQLASAQGGASPALRRQAMFARSSGEADLGGQAAIAAAREQQQAANIVQGALGQQQGLDLAGRASQLSQFNQQAGLIGRGDQARSYLAAQEAQRRSQLDNRAAQDFAASDERAKKDISHADVRKLLDSLKPQEWTYKDDAPVSDEDKKKRHLGVMAQDLEKSPAGKRMVFEGPDGVKRVDYSGKTFGPVAMAALADLHERTKRLERRKTRG